MAIEKLKRTKSPVTDQIPTEFIKAGCEIIRPEVHKLVNSIWNEEEMSEERKDSITLPNYKKGDKTD